MAFRVRLLFRRFFVLFLADARDHKSDEPLTISDMDSYCPLTEEDMRRIVKMPLDSTCLVPPGYDSEN